MTATRRFERHPVDAAERPSRPSRAAASTTQPAAVLPRAGAALEPRQVNVLQRSIGNRAVRALLSGAALEPAETSSGRALPRDVRAKMEASFGADFRDVRVHEEPRAEAIGAEAFTRGDHIHFAPGRYDPHGEAGQRLLGHELTHVVQQRAGGVSVPQAKAGRLVADEGLEAEADVLGDRAARGEPVTVRGMAIPQGIQRMIAKGKKAGFRVKGVYDDAPFTGVIESEDEKGPRPQYKVKLDAGSVEVIGKTHLDVEHSYLDANQEDETSDKGKPDPSAEKVLGALKSTLGRAEAEAKELSTSQVTAFETKMVAWIRGPEVELAKDFLRHVVAEPKRAPLALRFVKTLTDLMLRDPGFIMGLVSEPAVDGPLIQAVNAQRMTSAADAYLLEGIIHLFISTRHLQKAQEILSVCISRDISRHMDCGRLLRGLAKADATVGLEVTRRCIEVNAAELLPHDLVAVLQQCVVGREEAVESCIALYAKLAPDQIKSIASGLYALPLPKARLGSLLLETLSPLHEPEPMRLFVYSLLDKVETTSFPEPEHKTLLDSAGLPQRTTLMEFGKALNEVLNRLEQDSRLAASEEPLRRLHAALAQCREYAIMVQRLLRGELDEKTGNMEGVELLVDSIAESIKKLKKPSEERDILLYPTGFARHATILAVVRQLDELYQIIQFNTGDMIEAHGAPRVIGGKQKHRTYLEISDVKEEDATSRELWRALVRNDAAKDMTGVYSALSKVPGRRESEEGLEVLPIYFEMKQRLGSCTWQSIMALLRFYLLEAYKSAPEEGLLQYKLLKSRMSDVIFEGVMKERPAQLSDRLREAAELKLVKRRRYQGLDNPGAVIDFEGVKNEFAVRLKSLDPDGKNERVASAIERVASLKQPEGALTGIGAVDLLYEAFVAALRMTELDPAGLEVDVHASPIVAAAFARYKDR